MRIIDMRQTSANTWAPQEPNRLLPGTAPLGYVPHRTIQQQPALGQTQGCPSMFWGVVGGAVTWALFGDTILSAIGLGKKATEKGIKTLQSKLG